MLCRALGTWGVQRQETQCICLDTRCSWNRHHHSCKWVLHPLRPAQQESRRLFLYSGSSSYHTGWHLICILMLLNSPPLSVMKTSKFTTSSATAQKWEKGGRRYWCVGILHPCTPVLRRGMLNDRLWWILQKGLKWLWWTCAWGIKKCGGTDYQERGWCTEQL